MKKNIAVVAGGYSSEREVSHRSAAFVMKCLENSDYYPWMVDISIEKWELIDSDQNRYDIDKSDFSAIIQGQKISFEAAYIMIHGTPGEDGKLQGYFDMIGIPYSSCSASTSSLTFNKYYCNKFLSQEGIEVAASTRILTGDSWNAEKLVADLGLPMFIKPNAGGSSFGVTKVKAVDQVDKAIEAAFAEGDEVLCEAFMDGREFTCGALVYNGEVMALPATEVITENEFFNYEAKYVVGKALEITPARLDDKETHELQKLTQRIYHLLDCDGIIRADFIYDGTVFRLLEVNTVPGMTETSFIPQQIRAAGFKETDILVSIINDILN